MTTTTNFSTVHSREDSSIFIQPEMAQIVHICCQVIIYCVGLYIQIKTIQACNKDKGKTWEIHISHAIVTSVYYGFFIPFQAVTTFVPSLSIYMGSWICYVASFISFYSYHAIIANSLLVAITKYIFIVHAFKARVFGDDKIERIFFWINTTLPLALSAIAMLTTNFHTRSALKSCFGTTEYSSLLPNNSTSGSQNFLLCDSVSSMDHGPILYYILQFLCVSRKILNWIIVSNLPEAFFYHKIFCYMKK